MEWIDALNRTLQFIESHLEDDADAGDAARCAGYSPFYLQRIFAMLTGMTLGEYQRARRLSEAGTCLRRGESVLETALRFGWDSPESFARAFRRFHGVSPSAVKGGRAILKYMTPLILSIELKGGRIMDYTVEKRPELTVMGRARRFGCEDSFVSVPKFWDEYMEKGWDAQVPGRLGLCLDGDASGSEFEYWIGRFCEPDEVPPEGFQKTTIPAMTWALFECAGPLPEAPQKLTRRIFSEWLPGNGQYETAAPLTLEWYTEGDRQAANYRSGIMIPVRARN